MSEFKLPSRLSLSDVAMLDVCIGGSCADLPFEQLLDIAYEHGLNVKQSYKIEKGLHRNLQNKVINGEYIVAEERLDDVWIKSGNATIEAITICSDDYGMRDELNRMRGRI